MCDLNGCGSHHKLPPITINPEQRRNFLKGLACLPLASILAYPEFTAAQAAKTETVSVKLADGSTAKAALALPAAKKAPTVILIHEWWGLNNQIKAVAAELANLGYITLAVDLYDGKIAKKPEDARKYMKTVDGAKATKTMTAWADWLKNHPRSSGKVATIGWCFGGGWSLNTSVATPIDATIIYYGRVTTKADKLKNLQGPVLGHFGTLDKSINKAMVSGFENEMKTAGKDSSLTVHWYKANHAFANPTGARYDAEDAALAWQRTTAFLKQHLS